MKPQLTNFDATRLFSAKVRLCLARVVWALDLKWQLGDHEQDWLEQKGWFTYEPTPLLVQPVLRSVSAKPKELITGSLEI